MRALERIAIDVKFAVERIAVGPCPALSRERRMPPYRCRNHRMASAAAGERNDVIAMGAADLQWLVFAACENIRHFVAKG